MNKRDIYDAADASCLDRFHAMHAYNPRAGGILMPIPESVDFHNYQGNAVKNRLEIALEKIERERFQEATGIEIVPAVKMSDIATGRAA